MAHNKNAPMSMYLLTILWTAMLIQFPETSSAIPLDNLGVCYGLQVNNLPPSAQTAALYLKYNITNVRLVDPRQVTPGAFGDTGIRAVFGVPNEFLRSIASSKAEADTWVQQNVLFSQAYGLNVSHIFVGDALIPGPLARYVAPAMQNIRDALAYYHLLEIKVTTAVSINVLQNSNPPSASEYVAEVKDAMVAVLDFLVKQDPAVLMVNAFPYFAYAANPSQISLDYALSNSTQPVVRDGNLTYTNLLDAMIDGIHWANEKLGARNVGVAVSATGWPSAGNGKLTTPELAATYNKNFVRKITSGVGTPKRPGQRFDGFIFALYNEDMKPAGVEQNWGLFHANNTPVYNVFS